MRQRSAWTKRASCAIEREDAPTSILLQKRKGDVPSRHTVLRATRTRPSGRRRMRFRGEGRAAQRAAERLQAGAIVRGPPDVGVEIEAIELGLTRAAGVDVTEVRPVAEAAAAAARRGGRGRRGPGRRRWRGRPGRGRRRRAGPPGRCRQRARGGGGRAAAPLGRGRWRGRARRPRRSGGGQGERGGARVGSRGRRRRARACGSGCSTRIFFSTLGPNLSVSLFS